MIQRRQNRGGNEGARPRKAETAGQKYLFAPAIICQVYQLVKSIRLKFKTLGGRGFAPDPTGELTALPKPPSWWGGGLPHNVDFVPMPLQWSTGSDRAFNIGSCCDTTLYIFNASSNFEYTMSAFLRLHRLWCLSLMSFILDLSPFDIKIIITYKTFVPNLTLYRCLWLTYELVTDS